MQSPRSHCYISSTVGAVVVGVITLILSLIGAILMTITYSEEYRRNQYWHPSFPYAIHEVYIVMLCLAIAMASGSMMYGVIKEKHAFMFPWIATFVTATGTTISFFLAVIISYIVAWDFLKNLYDFSIMSGISLAIATVEIMLCAVVYNHYKQLISRKQPTQSSHPYSVSDIVIKSPIAYQKV